MQADRMRDGEDECADCANQEAYDREHGGRPCQIVGRLVCLLAGQMWARVVAVIVAMLSAVANIAFLPAYPIWSAILITVDVLVIWAVTVHGSEIK